MEGVTEEELGEGGEAAVARSQGGEGGAEQAQGGDLGRCKIKYKIQTTTNNHTIQIHNVSYRISVRKLKKIQKKGKQY